MKESEIREVAECKSCGRPFGACGGILFFRVKIDQYMVNLGALKRQQGLAMLTGSAQLAVVMGPDEDMAAEMASVTVTLCEECALGKQHNVAELMEGDSR